MAMQLTPEINQGQGANRGLPGHPWSLAAQEWARTAPGIGRYLIATEYGCGQYWGPRAVIQSSFDTSLMERFAREAPPGRIGIRFRQAGIGTVMYAATMGFVMAAEYGTFNFDGGTAGRWREFWTKNAVLVHNQDDKFLFFSLAGRPTGKESVPASSVLPGLDEQWLGMTDRTMRSADIEGWSAAALPRAAEEYRRVARSTGSPAAWERLGTSLLRMGRAAEARAALREAERRGRRSAVLFDAMGYLESRDGNAAQAAACFRRSLEFDPGLEEARRNLAVLLLDMGRREEAVRLVQEGLALDPGSMGLRELMLGISGRQ